jgi:hypothetical protein
VLLVDDDGAEVLHRREDRRARANRDALVPAAKGQPRIVPLAVGQRAVQHGDAVAEDRAKAVNRLRREGDLRHQHDRRLPLVDHDASQQLEIDERFARPRDAVEQRDVARRCHGQPIDRV